MAEPLRDSFLADLRCSEAEATALADRARAWLRPRESGEEDTDEDLIVRLRDPRVYGDFVAAVITDPRLGPRTRRSLAEGAFDLLPLPGSEGDVILVESRSPRRLLALAAFLAAEDGLTVLHAMHLLYAVFLDRGLVTEVDWDVRAVTLEAVLALPEANERVKVLYACLHLSSVPESEAHRELRRLLRGRTPSDSVKRSIALAASSEDGGVARLASLARDEGLLPEEAGEVGESSVIVNIPRMPPGLRASARRWLRLHGDG